MARVCGITHVRTFEKLTLSRVPPLHSRSLSSLSSLCSSPSPFLPPSSPPQDLSKTTGTHLITLSQTQDRFLFLFFFFSFLFFFSSTNVESQAFCSREQRPHRGHYRRGPVVAMTSLWRATPHPRRRGLGRHVTRYCDAPRPPPCKPRLLSPRALVQSPPAVRAPAVRAPAPRD